MVSPDLGNAKEAAAFARLLGVPVAAGAKQRIADDQVVISAMIGEVAGKDVIVLDDEIAKGSTVIELLEHLRERGVALGAGGLHPRAVLRPARSSGSPPARGAGDRLHQHRPDRRTETRTDKLTVLSVAPALAEAMRRIHDGESVSELFDEQ